MRDVCMYGSIISCLTQTFVTTHLLKRERVYRVVRDIILAVLSTVVLFLFVQNGKLKIRLENIEALLIDAMLLELLEREEK